MTGLIIVESPNKVKSIQKYVGNSYKVAASVGHITALGNTRAGKLGFEVSSGKIDIDFVPNGERGQKTINNLLSLARNCDEIILASDPDREGEAIAWHCMQQVGNGKKISRITYTEITQEAVLAALQNKRSIDLDLVHAQFGRQLLDKWIGYTFSGLLIRDTDGQARSVGRVQSAALAILCELEQTITHFKPEPYWALTSTYGEGFTARFVGNESVGMVDDDASDQVDDTGEEREDPTGKRVVTKADAERLVAIAQHHPHQVIECSGRDVKSKPPAALTTSSMQQLAGSRLGFSTDKSMKVAQHLFEGMDLPNGKTGGVITYHRTDSVSLSDEFCDAARGWLTENHPELVPAKATKHKTKGNAQGAHEAIRPTDVGLTPEIMKGTLSSDQLALYSLIWQRAVASQCAPALLKKTKVVIQSGSTFWASRGSVLQSPGYTTIFNNMGGDSVLPELAKGQQLSNPQVSYTEKKTSPPGRKSEPQLVATMEKLGVGRPSTYASIMATLRARGYVQDVGKGKKQKLQPTSVGMTCYDWLHQELALLINPKFTARMEDSLDQIASGDKNWEAYLTEFGQSVIDPAVAKITKRLKDKPPSGATDFTCLVCAAKMVQRSYKTKGGRSGVLIVCPQDQERSHPAFFQTKKGFWNPDFGNARTDITADALPDLAQLKAEYANAKKKADDGEATPYVCTKCGGAIAKITYQKDGKTKHLLKCTQDSKHPVYFFTQKGWWNPGGVELHDANGEVKQAKADDGEATPYICKECGGAIAKISYQKDGKTKQLLKCTQDSKHPVYFFTQNGWWNPDDIPLHDANGAVKQEKGQSRSGSKRQPSCKKASAKA